MEGYVAINGIPKFAMDDVEIVLDELCSGYDKATECRMRKELFDHYQSAFDDAVGEGLGEEDAHEKVLQDLGWETTLMVGEVCREMNWWSGKQIRGIINGGNYLKAKKGYIVLILVALLMSLKFYTEKEWINFFLMMTMFFLILGLISHAAYKTKTPFQRPLLKRDDIKRKFNKFLWYQYAFWLVVTIESTVLYQWFPERDALVQWITYAVLNSTSISILIWSLKINFGKVWNRIYPQDRIF